MPPSMREVLTVPMICEARRRYPDLILHLHEGISMTLAEFTRSGRLDCATNAFCSYPQPLGGIVSRPKKCLQELLNIL